MIVTTIASTIALLFGQASVNVPRTAFSSCVAETRVKAEAEKVKPDAFGDYLRAACQPAGAKLKTALIAFDTKNGVGRAQASEDAQTEIDDTVNSAVRTYERMNSEMAQVQQ